jgi:hypothetical protein
MLGVIHELGLGVPRDRARARSLYRQACERRNLRACGNLGELLLADVRPGDAPDGALVLLRTACDAGHGRACAVIGRAQATGVVVSGGPSDAAVWFERGCAGGEVSSCVALADLVESPGRRAELLTLACARGDADGCARLAAPPPVRAPIVVGTQDR